MNWPTYSSKDYEWCTRPDVCSGCLQRRDLKKECRRRVLERMNGETQGDLLL
jgi:hypothetical protein